MARHAIAEALPEPEPQPEPDTRPSPTGLEAENAVLRARIKAIQSALRIAGKVLGPYVPKT
jgi:hypothetical protein